MASVGSLAVQLVANGDGLSKGLKQAEKKISAFAGTVGGGGLFKTFGAGLSAAGGAVDSFFAPMKGLLGMVPLVGGALASFPTTVGGLADWFKQGSDAILATDKAAKRLGADVGDVAPILAAAGGDSEGLTRSLFKLQQRVQGLAEDDKSAVNAFGRLGVSFDMLAGRPLPQQLGIIADKINGLANPSERAAAAFSLFGKQGAELMPLLSKGSKGLQEAAARMNKLGFGLNAADVDQVRQADRAFKQIDLAVAGVKRQLAIGLAPVLTSAVEQIGALGVSFDGLADAAMSAAYAVAKVGTLGLGSGVDKAFSEMREKVNEARAKAEGDRLRNQLEGEIQRAYAKADAMKNVSGFLGPTAALFAPDAQKRAEEMAERFKKKFGEAPKPRQGEDLFSLFEKTQGVIDANQSPLDKFNKRVAELNKLTDKGGLGWDDYAVAVARAVDELDKGAKVEGPAALFQGSAEAMSAVSRAALAAGAGGGSAQDRIEKLLRQAKEQQEKQVEAARDTAKAVKQIFKRGI